ncbi:MAG: dCTP deaminase [Candidatus Hydrothermarchaeota archaeon]
MYLSSKEIKERIKADRLLEGHEDRNIQGAGVDLRIGRLFSPASGASLGVEKRELPEMQEIEEARYDLAPGSYSLCLTMEEVRMPHDLVAFIYPRSTLFRCGVGLRTAVVDPGYEGPLTLGIKNEGAHPFALERGARIAQIVFAEVQEGATNYSGRYQGGKVR